MFYRDLNFMIHFKFLILNNDKKQVMCKDISLFILFIPFQITIKK